MRWLSCRRRCRHARRRLSRRILGRRCPTRRRVQCCRLRNLERHIFSPIGNGLWLPECVLLGGVDLSTPSRIIYSSLSNTTFLIGPTTVDTVTALATQRGRVRAFNRWPTLMIAGSPTDKIERLLLLTHFGRFAAHLEMFEFRSTLN